MDELRDYLTATPEPVPEELLSLARSYYDRTEAYDRTVCTGPIGKDGILPANYRESGLINRNALNVRREVREQALRLGYDEEQFKHAMRIAAQEGR